VADRAEGTADGDTAKTKLAGMLLMDKKTDEAKKLVDAILQDDPKNEEALLTLAAISLAAEDAGTSIADLRTLLNENPGNVKALRLKARAHLKQNEMALARESLETAIQASPQEAAANFELAQLLLQTGKPDDAIAVLEKMQKFAPDHVGIMLGLAKIYVAQKNWDEVTKVAKQMQAKHPDKALGYHFEGVALQASGKLEESVKLFERSLQISPNAAEPLIAEARSWVALKQPDKALERVEQSIAQNGKNFLAYNLKGEILIAQKRLGEAAAAFKKANEVNPKWPVPYRNLAKLSMLAKDVSKAIGLLEDGVKNTNDPSLTVELATIYDANKRETEARDLYEKLLAANPGLGVAKNNLAMILVRGAPPAKADLDRALELTKDFTLSKNPVFEDTLGWVHYKRGENKQAVTLLERAYDAKLQIPDIAYHLGMAYTKAGSSDKAIEKLEEALGYGRSFEGIDEAKQTLAELKSKPE
jgi:tetratricopeptide (TPR) repeat protein